MPELTSPLWLLGLALVPVIYWLHRFHGAEDERIVEALFLWAGTRQSAGAARRPVRPPRQWLLRALVVALLCVGLAGPVRQVAGLPPLVVWLDESISLHTVENGRTRRAALLHDLADALAARGGEDVEVRSLANTGRQLAVSPNDDVVATLLAWTQDSIGDPLPPMPALTPGEAEHWLVTDGASAGLDTWTQRLAFTRVFQTGQLTSNSAIDHLAIRPQIDDAGGYAVLVRVVSTPSAGGSRMVTLLADDEPVARRPVDLSARVGLQLDFQLNEPLPRRLTARLEAADALPMDDVLTLSTAALAPARVLITGTCPAPLTTALANHPGLTLIRDQPDLVVACGDTAAIAPTARLLFDIRPGSPAPQPLIWHAGAGALLEVPLADRPALIRPVAAPGAVLASVAGWPVIVQTARNPSAIQVGLDMSDPGFADHPGYAALISGLASRALNRDLLDPVAKVGARGPVAIAPRPVTVATDRSSPPPATRRTDLAGWLAMAACLLVLTDATLLQRRFRTLSPGAR